MKSLEASMIIMNEEQMLPRALDCLKGIDKITICDTGSSDGTFKVYEDYQKKGYNLEWFKYSLFNTEDHIKSFSHARNECKEHCSCDWLLILDGDEWFDWDVKRLKDIINSGWAGKYDVLMMNCKTAQEETTQPRAFKNIDSIWYYGPYHNTLMYITNGQAQHIGLNKRYVTSLLLHADYSPNHSVFPDRTLNILTEALNVNPYDTRALYYMAREWLQRHEPLKALFYLQLYTELSMPSNEAAEVYFLISTIYADMQIWPKAAENALKCIGILPTFKQAWQMIYSLSSEQFKPYWKNMLDAADNKGVMFVRK